MKPAPPSTNTLLPNFFIPRSSAALGEQFHQCASRLAVSAFTIEREATTTGTGVR